MPTENLMDMLAGMGIETGVDVKELIEAVWMCEEIVGRSLMGHVSKVGPSPSKFDELFDPNMPFVETVEQARHCITGSKGYDGGVYPWREAISSLYCDRLEKGLPAYEVDGDGP